MAKPTRSRRVVLVLVVSLGVLAGLLGLLQLVSPRSAGEPIAARRRIPHPAVIAHRGLSFWAPEETRAAYLLAREIGADYLEADVQRTQDGVLIALHDDTLDRTTDVAAVFPERRGRGPEAFTWQELQRLDAGSWYNAAHPERSRPSFVGQRILRLEELLDIAGAHAPGRGSETPGLYLETKGAAKYQGYERELVALLRARGWLAPRPAEAPGFAPVLFQSFVPESLARLRELAPEVPRVLLVDRDDLAREPWSAFVRRASELGAGLGPSGYQGMPWHTGPAHRAGLLVHHYTINQAWQLRMLRLLGSDGVFTDTADLALKVYGRGQPGDRAAILRAAFQETGL
jgi:glycerophosphoryl diester phosphodiesterase